MSRSLNQVTLIGNLTRDPEMRYTPQGSAVTSFGIATNRVYTHNGEKKEEVEFHNIVAWGKLAELCAQMLRKGRKIYLQGRLQTRSWDAQDGSKRTRTEIVADDMIILDNKFVDGELPSAPTAASTEAPESVEEVVEDKTEGKTAKKKESKKEDEPSAEAWVSEEDIPF